MKVWWIESWVVEEGNLWESSNLCMHGYNNDNDDDNVLIFGCNFLHTKRMPTN